MDTGRLSQGQVIAAASAVLLIISLFLKWFGTEGSVSISGWESQNTLDIYLTIVALFALVPTVLALTGSGAEVPFAPAAATFLLGAIGIILTAYVVIDGEGTKIGVWLALIAVIGVTVGAYLAMQDELAEEY
ncbi:MAG TPA: hypothetical protein VHH72_09720 [Solirubrobacterales bacterium]|jgi:hypothetical protein|nr:hypothetical protein [Solirubrobacterales bacterium]